MLITAEQVIQFINNLKAVGIVAKPADIAAALKKVDKNKQCQMYDADREQHVKAVIRFALIQVNKNAEWLKENDVDDEFEEVLQSMADAYVKEEYMGINISRVLVDLSDTRYETTAEKLKAVINTFETDGAVIEAYKEFVGFDTDEEDDEDAQAIQGDLEFAYRCTLLDRLKEGLGIPQDIPNDPDDTHTICYDAINEYDEDQLLPSGMKDSIVQMANEHYEQTDEFFEMADSLKEAGYIESMDFGDTINWEEDMKSQVAASIYRTELARLENI